MYVCDICIYIYILVFVTCTKPPAQISKNRWTFWGNPCAWGWIASLKGKSSHRGVDEAIFLHVSKGWVNHPVILVGHQRIFLSTSWKIHVVLYLRGSRLKNRMSWGKVGLAWTSSWCSVEIWVCFFTNPMRCGVIAKETSCCTSGTSKYASFFSSIWVPGLVRTTLVLCFYWLSDLFSTASSLWLVPWLHHMQWSWFVFNWQAHPPSKNLQLLLGDLVGYC